MIGPDSAWGVRTAAAGRSDAGRGRLRWRAPAAQGGDGLVTSPANGMERRAVHVGQAVAWSGALLFAFLPVLADLTRHLALSPWARYALLFPLLFVRAARREPGRTAPGRPDAALWVVAGLLIAAVALFLGETRWGRLGLLCAVIGLCRRFGWGTWRSQALLLFAVPVPNTLLRAAQPLAELLSRIAGALVGPLGADVDALWLGRYGSGLALAPLLAGLGWYAALLRDLPLRTGLRLAAGAGVVAVPLQLLALVTAAVAALVLGNGAARAALVNAPPLLAAVAGLVLAERGLRSGARA